MLFFYGIRASTIATEPLPGLACAHCQTPDALICTVVSRYLHLFWIPVFPIGKASATACRHCKQVLAVREMPASYRAPVQAVQQQAKTPLTHFALLLLVGAVMAFGLLMSLFGKPGHRDTPAEAAAETSAAAPATAATPTTAGLVGTRYKINLTPDGHQYTLAQVTKTTPDSVYFRLTNPLRAELSDAGASLALRDSVAPGNARQRLSAQQWQQSTTGQGVFKRLD
jgi:hypothetical protein